MAHLTGEIETVPLAFRSGARTQLRSYLVSSRLSGSRDQESPRVELHCSLITPPARFLREIVFAGVMEPILFWSTSIWLAASSSVQSHACLTSSAEAES